MKVYLNSDDYKYKNQIIKLIDYEIDYNPDFNGVNYTITKDDYTWIEDINELHGTLLRIMIENLVQELTYPD